MKLCVIFRRETEKARLVETASGACRFWAPKSISEVSAVSGACGMIDLPEWFVRKEGLSRFVVEERKEEVVEWVDPLAGKSESEIRQIVEEEWGGIVAKVEGELWVWNDPEAELAYRETEGHSHHPRKIRVAA